jgi:hypothetical protein
MTGNGDIMPRGCLVIAAILMIAGIVFIIKLFIQWVK